MAEVDVTSTGEGTFVRRVFPARLVDERAGKRVRSFRYAGVNRAAMTVGGSEHLGLPEVFPQLESVDVGLGWFGRWTRPAE